MRSPASLQTQDSHCRVGVDAYLGETKVCQPLDTLKAAKDKPDPNMTKPLIQRGSKNKSRGDGT